jgi:hypothetical protein
MISPSSLAPLQEIERMRQEINRLFGGFERRRRPTAAWPGRR